MHSKAFSRVERHTMLYSSNSDIWHTVCIPWKFLSRCNIWCLCVCWDVHVSFFVFQSLHSAHQFASMVTLMILVLLCPCIGLQITVYSLEEIVKFLLGHGFQYVLTSKFNQDPLEEHFGWQRQVAGRSTNPTLQMLGVQENMFRIQRSIATCITPKGNILKVSKDPRKGLLWQQVHERKSFNDMFVPVYVAVTIILFVNPPPSNYN